MSPDFTDDDLDRVQKKHRPKGSLPYLPGDMDDPEALRDWLTLAFRPPKGWRIHSFERQGRDKNDPCTLVVANGRESKRYRFKNRELTSTPRLVVIGVSDGKLAMPHLTGGEVEDVWVALCTLGSVLTEWDEPQETAKWIEQYVLATLPLFGHTLVPDGRHAALMALKLAGEFTRPDATAMMRSEQHYTRPTRFVDAQTGEQWLRAGETATYLRWVLGIEPLSGSTLTARLAEVGVVYRLFEDYRPPHPKLRMYQLTEELAPPVAEK